MNRKIVFLDIDGVLQPGYSQKRFDTISGENGESGMPKLYRYLEYYFKIDYRKYNQYDVAAVYCDWDKIAVDLLKLTLSLTGAKIVLSSDWRREGFDRMKDFFTMHGLEKFYIDNTKDYNDLDISFVEEVKTRYKEKNGPDSYLDYRSIEILEWLSRNPDVKKWVAIDDMRLSGLGDNFINTRSSYTWEDAEKAIRLLSVNSKKKISQLKGK